MAQHWVYNLITSAWTDVWKINDPSLSLDGFHDAWSAEWVSFHDPCIKIALYMLLSDPCSAICFRNAISAVIWEYDILLLLMAPLWRCRVYCRRSWWWGTVMTGPLSAKRHLMLLAISRRRTVSSLIGIWRLAIVCRFFSESIIHKLSKNVHILTWQL